MDQAIERLEVRFKGRSGVREGSLELWEDGVLVVGGIGESLAVIPVGEIGKRLGSADAVLLGYAFNVRCDDGVVMVAKVGKRPDFVDRAIELEQLLAPGTADPRKKGAVSEHGCMGCLGVMLGPIGIAIAVGHTLSKSAKAARRDRIRRELRQTLESRGTIGRKDQNGMSSSDGAGWA